MYGSILNKYIYTFKVACLIKLIYSTDHSCLTNAGFGINARNLTLVSN